MDWPGISRIAAAVCTALLLSADVRNSRKVLPHDPIISHGCKQRVKTSTEFVVAREALGRLAAGLRPLATNWPRALHEGNWNVIVGPLANGLVSVLFLGLVGTGLTIWLRRRLKQAAIRRSRLTAAQA